MKVVSSNISGRIAGVKMANLSASVIPSVRLQGFKEKTQFEACIMLNMIGMNKLKLDNAELIKINILYKEIIEKLSCKYRLNKVRFCY